MEFIGWEDNFDERIIERGRRYFDSGCVSDLTVQKGEASADVYGSRCYHVKIKWEDNEITKMSCDCPYEDDCKHMVAVLYALRTVKEPKGRKKAEKLDQLVMAAGEKELREFLLDVLKDDGTLEARFRNFVSKGNGKIDIEPYMKRVRKIARKCTGAYGFLEYGGLDNYQEEIDGILEKDVSIFIRKGHLKEACELVTQVFDAFTELNDEEDDLYAISDPCVEAMKKILAEKDAESERFLFDWCIGTIESDLDERSYCMHEAVCDLFDEQFESGGIAEEKLSYIKDKAEAGSYGYMTKYLGLLLARRTPWKKIEGYCKERMKYSSVRDWYVDKCLGKKKNDEAILILEQGCEFEKDNGYKLESYKRQLKDLYAKKGDRESCRQTLWWLVENGRSEVPLKLLNELRPFYDEETWKTERERVFARARSTELCDLYRAEGLTERLLDEVLKLSSVKSIVEYAPDLPDDAQKLLDRCKELLQKAVNYVNKRRDYEELAGNLRLFDKIDGGRKLAAGLISDWKLLFRRKPALMEELGKVEKAFGTAATVKLRLCR